MVILRAFVVKAWVIQNLLPLSGGIKVCPKCAMQSDVQLADIPEHFHGDSPVVKDPVSLCRSNKLVP